MAYESTNWKDGDLVTSAKLNKIEQGIADATSSPYFIISDDINDEWKANKTWKEAMDAFNAGKILVYASLDSNGNIERLRMCKYIDLNTFDMVFDGLSLFVSEENDYLTLAD